MPVTTRPPRLTNLSYNDLRAWANMSGGQVDKWIETINASGYDVSEIEAIEAYAESYMDFYKNADGTYTVTQFKEPFQATTGNAIDSNVSTVSRGSVSQMLNRGKDAITGKLKITKFPASGSFTSQASYVLGSVGYAIGAVSSGIALGKKIDGALYNANPDFWNSIGWSTLNPDTWNNITNGDDSNFAGLFNFILGLDPSTGNTQAYMDERTFAYMAYGMALNGIFNPETGYVSGEVGRTTTFDIEDYGIVNCADNATAEGSSPYPQTMTWETTLNSGDARMGVWLDTNASGNPIATIVTASLSQYSVHYKRTYTRAGTTTINEYDFNASPTNVRGVNIYQHVYANISLGAGSNVTGIPAISWTGTQADLTLALAAGTYTQGGSIDGISNQEGATLPNISDWDSYDDVLPSLQQQYPDLFANPLVWDNVQPDGTNPQLRYIPVPMPIATSNTDTQPTSGTQTQTQTVINPDTSVQTLIDLITELSTKTETDSDPSIPPQNPVDVGTGETPTPIAPTGDGSALWSVYHPTQGQVDQFGAWLWTGNIITQIQQVLQNPMEGIITLHKVFATPVDSGTGTIVVGRLDSNVASATVNQQYVTVDCGHVDCMEYFSNVFDYSPYTNVSLYLPFIGIVPLNTEDIMRSTIQVTYGVDVFTGACLAMVEVTRDGNTINMYQYAGVASVEYPLTGSVHSGLITGLLGIAGSVAATVATGGVAAPAVIASVGGLASASASHNARAGGFSGNAGAMGIKKPYLIIERPQTKIAETFPELAGYPTNYSCKLNECSGHVVVRHAHIEGINATDSELSKISSILISGVIV